MSTWNGARPLSEAETAAGGEALLPSNVDAERACLGAALMDEAAWDIIDRYLTPEAWDAVPHQHLHRAALALRARGQPRDLITLTDELAQMRVLDTEVGGITYVSSLPNQVPTSDLRHVEGYAVIVQRAAVAREYVRLSGKLAAVGAARGEQMGAEAAALAAEMLQLERRLTHQRAAARFPLRSVADLRASGSVAPLIAGVLARVSTVHAFGPPGSGKTTVFEDMALHICRGARWQGRAVTQGHVIIVQNDSTASATWDHAEAWLARHPEVSERDLDWFHVVTAPVELLQPETLPTLIEEWTAVLDGPLALVVLDSLSITAAPGDTDKNHDMRAYTAVMRRISEHFGCCVVAINHVGWADDKRPRGATSLVGNIDTVLRFEVVDADSKLVGLAAYRDRLSAADFRWMFRIESEPLPDGTDSEGFPFARSGPVVVPVVDAASSQWLLSGPSGAAQQQPERPLSESQRKDWRLFWRLYDEWDQEGVLPGTWAHAWEQTGEKKETHHSNVQRLRKRHYVCQPDTTTRFYPVEGRERPSDDDDD